MSQPRTSEGKGTGVRAVLEQRDFRWLWLGQICSQLADKFYIVLMVYLIAQHWVSSTPASNPALAEAAGVVGFDLPETRAQMITLLATGVYAANTLPAVLLGTVAGAWTDRWPKRRVMVASNGLRGLLVLFVPLALLDGPQWLGLGWGYWALLGLTFLESALTQFFAPAEQAAITTLIPQTQLLAANSVYQTTSMATTIVGFALGEPILLLLRHGLEQLGIAGGEFLLLPLCYGSAALAISRIRHHSEPRRRHEPSLWREIGQGLAVLRQRPRVARALAQLVLLYSLLAALYVLAISLAAAVPGLGPTRFGVLLAMSGLGLAAGALSVAQLAQHIGRRQLAALGLGLIGWSLLLLGQLLGNLTFTLLLCALLGVGAALLAIPTQTTIQEDTPASLRGKVFGLQNNLINIALSLPLVLAGATVSRWGLLPVLQVLAALALAAAVAERPWRRW
ncbi:MFS transporter [Cyanobium sp. CH-040]|uniref:MFS transporter n=1 Tax=Cyanobium sp. CH-040 TaxID=2823708 RepID=UPI0020CC6843|nr:MFS transporter [Cyanobium sp. CH-040]